MRIAYLDCFAGIAGDMFLGALVDAGVPRAILEDAAAAMKLDASLQFETVDRSGIAATKVSVLEAGRLADAPVETAPVEALQPHAPDARMEDNGGPGHAHPHVSRTDVADQQAKTEERAHGRSLTEIRSLIQESALAPEVKALAIRAFTLLGTTEAKIHNIPVDDVHFHEVGAVDAIIDIAACSAAIVSLGVTQWHCSPVNVGSGFVRCAHGLFPVPAPATADLLRNAPTYAAHVQKELVTPTGAALLRALEPVFGTQPAMAVQHTGYGAGTRNPAGFPNVLRLSVGEATTETPDAASAADGAAGAHAHSNPAAMVAVLETALDDATPQLLGYVTELALKLGALDVMLTPVVMKKGRPGTLLTVLAEPEDAGRFEQMLLRETTTLGIRIRHDRRVCLERTHVRVQTPFGEIRMKIGTQGGETLNATPEYEDCRRAAEDRGVPLKQVQAAAVAAYVSLPAHAEGGTEA